MVAPTVAPYVPLAGEASTSARSRETIPCSGATPNEKITWDKLTETTPMFVIESDATIVVPLVLRALLECKRHPAEAEALIARHLGSR